MKDNKNYVPVSNNVEEIFAILNNISIFSDFSNEQLRFIFNLLQKVFYAKGEKIFSQGEDPTHIYIIKNGKVNIVAEEKNVSREIAELFPGNCFGEVSVIGIQPHSATAIAKEDTELIVLSRENLLSIFKQDKEIFSILILNIARQTCRLLQQTDEKFFHYILSKRLKKACRK